MKLKLVAVSVGLPSIIAVTAEGQPVLSGIAKKPVRAQSVFVGRENIEGDGQADLRFDAEDDASAGAGLGNYCHLMPFASAGPESASDR